MVVQEFACVHPEATEEGKTKYRNSLKLGVPEKYARITEMPRRGDLEQALRKGPF